MSLPASSFDDDEPQPDRAADSPADARASRLGRRKAARQAELSDARPFVERYRGTPWGDAEEPAAGDAAQPRRNYLTWPVLIGAVLVVLAVAAFGLYVMFGQKAPTGMAAFREMTPAPSSVPGPASATPGPVGTGASSLPTISPAPQPWRADPVHPASLFIGQMGRSDISFHLDAQVGLVASSAMAQLDYGLDQSGADYSISIRRTALGAELNADMVVIGNNYWARVGDGRWQSGAGTPAPANVFCDLTLTSFDRVVYVGEENYRRHRLHHLQLPCTRWPGPLDRAISIVSAPRLPTWEVWVDDAGRVRFAELAMNASVRWDGADVAMTLSFDYRFSRFGKPMTIKVPLGR